MKHFSNTTCKNLEFSGSASEQIKFESRTDHHQDAAPVSHAAIETVQTCHLQPGKESIPGGNF